MLLRVGASIIGNASPTHSDLLGERVMLGLTRKEHTMATDPRWIDEHGNEIDEDHRGLVYDIRTLVDRRRALGLFGGIGVTALLAACAAPETTPTASAAATATTPSATATPTPSAAASGARHRGARRDRRALPGATARTA